MVTHATDRSWKGAEALNQLEGLAEFSLPGQAGVQGAGQAGGTGFLAGRFRLPLLSAGVDGGDDVDEKEGPDRNPAARRHFTLDDDEVCRRDGDDGEVEQTGSRTGPVGMTKARNEQRDDRGQPSPRRRLGVPDGPLPQGESADTAKASQRTPLLPDAAEVALGVADQAAAILARGLLSRWF